MRYLYCLIVGMLLLSSCAASTQSQAGKSPSSSRYLITGEEIANSTAQNAYEAIELLRPNLLRVRGSRGGGVAIVPAVYVDNLAFGTLSALRDIPAMNIKDIRYLDARDATTRFGTNNMGGAFLITTKGQ